MNHSGQGTQDGWVIIKSSDKTWSAGGRNGNPLQYYCLRNLMNSRKRQKDMTPEYEPLRLKGVQYATREKQRSITNSSRKIEVARQKRKQRLIVDISSGENKVWCCKEQYCIGTWNVRSMNQGKLDVVKQEIAKLNINILGISELKWMRMSRFNSDNHCIYYYGKNPLEEME